MTCPGCPTVPVVSRRLCLEVLPRVPLEQRHAILMASLEWLTARHPGINLYEGIHGRPYTELERDVIALETGLVAGLPCPLRTMSGDCLLGGLGPHFNHLEEAGKPPYGFLPMQIAATWDRIHVVDLVSRGLVADAKVSLLTRNEGLDVPLYHNRGELAPV